MQSRKDDPPMETHYHPDRFWLDSTGWFYLLRGNQQKGPFESKQAAEADLKTQPVTKSSEPRVYLAIGKKAVVFHGVLKSLDETSILVWSDEIIPQDCLEQSCLFYLSCLMMGSLLEFELKCHIFKIANPEIELRIDLADKANASKLEQLKKFLH